MVGSGGHVFASKSNHFKKAVETKVVGGASIIASVE